MFHPLKELEKIMDDFLTNIEKAIGVIHVNNGVDNATVTKEVSDAVTAGVAPLQAQLTDQATKISNQETEIAELKTALTDTVAKLTAGDVPAATAIATAAAPAAGA